jgi:hypothetical protein
MIWSPAKVNLSVLGCEWLKYMARK